jgi:hypothetical protein
MRNFALIPTAAFVFSLDLRFLRYGTFRHWKFKTVLISLYYVLYISFPYIFKHRSCGSQELEGRRLWRRFPDPERISNRGCVSCILVILLAGARPFLLGSHLAESTSFYQPAPILSPHLFGGPRQVVRNPSVV